MRQSKYIIVFHSWEAKIRFLPELHVMAEGGVLLLYTEQEDSLTWLNSQYASVGGPIVGLDEMLEEDGWGEPAQP